MKKFHIAIALFTLTLSLPAKADRKPADADEKFKCFDVLREEGVKVCTDLGKKGECP